MNNHFGMPLQLLKLEPEHEIAVIEMGMSHAGEITRAGALARAELRRGHHGGSGAPGVFRLHRRHRRAKYELIESLPADGIAVLNADDPYVSQFGRDFSRQGRDVRAA